MELIGVQECNISPFFGSRVITSCAEVHGLGSRLVQDCHHILSSYRCLGVSNVSQEGDGDSVVLGGCCYADKVPLNGVGVLDDGGSAEEVGLAVCLAVASNSCEVGVRGVSVLTQDFERPNRHHLG